MALPLEDENAAELSRLRNEVVAQARELAVIRWEMSALMHRHLVSGPMHRVKIFLQRRLPRQVRQLTRLRRGLRQAFSLLQRPYSFKPIVDAGATNHSLPALVYPVLFIGEDVFAGRLTGALRTGDVMQLVQGAGMARSLNVPQANEPPLRTPADGSFVKWLCDVGERQLRKFNTILLNAGDEISLGLLRGRVQTHQMLALLNRPLAAPYGPSTDLGEPNTSDANGSYFNKLPTDWLDPLSDDRRPIAAIVGQMTWPKISVIMVSFNQASFLEEGLRSVLDQGYPNLEFIVVDGHSTDGSIEILERYRDKLAVLIIEPDRGQSDGLNKGFAHATGDILTWVNSDDLLEPGALFRVAQAFGNYPVDMVAGGCRQIGLSRDTIIVNHHTRLPFGIPMLLPLGLLLDFDRFWSTGAFFYQPEVFFTRDIWTRSGGKLRTDLNYILDYDLWVRMAAAGATIVHIPEFLACSRTHEQQKTTVGQPNMPEFQRLLREYAQRLLN